MQNIGRCNFSSLTLDDVIGGTPAPVVDMSSVKYNIVEDATRSKKKPRPKLYGSDGHIYTKKVSIVLLC